MNIMAWILAIPLLFLLCQTLVTASAPGDENPVCATPNYLQGIIVLMDSWRYQSLLSPLPPSPADPSAVWISQAEQINLAQWYGTGGTCDQGRIEVCVNDDDMRQPGQVYTQYISKPSSISYSISIFVETWYTLTQCEMMDCENFELLAYITNTPDTEERTDDGNYHNGLINPDSDIPSTNVQSPNTTALRYFSLSNDENGFYLLFENKKKMCVTIRRVVVYIKTCPSTENGLVRYTTTPVPFTGNVPSIGRCAENAHHTEASIPETLRCSFLGWWISDQTQCECDQGFYQDNTLCRACLTPVQDSYIVGEEQRVFQICLQMAPGLPLSLPLTVSTNDITAIGGYDYVPVSENITKSQYTTSTAPVIGCITLSLVDDSLKEGEESFSVEVRNGSLILAQILVNISSSDVESTCTEGSISLSRGSDNSSLQLVEMCDSNEGVWSPLCDNAWTVQDATVICRETTQGLSLKEYNVRSSVQPISRAYECSGTEMAFSQCSISSTTSSTCNHLLVQCERPPPPTTVTSPNSTTQTTVVLQESLTLKSLTLEVGERFSTTRLAILKASPSLGANQLESNSTSTTCETQRITIIAGVAVSLLIVILLVVIAATVTLCLYRGRRNKMKYSNEKISNGSSSPSSQKKELKNPVYEGLRPIAPTVQPSPQTEPKELNNTIYEELRPIAPTVQPSPQTEPSEKTNYCSTGPHNAVYDFIL